MRYFLFFSYNGKSYHGWQKQKKSVTIQQKVEESLSIALKQKIEVVGAGRTDSGVHAKQMVAHFDFDVKIENSKNLVYKLNQLLFNDISVKSIKLVKQDAHARYDAISRTYEYHITREKDVFLNELSYYINFSLKIEKISKAIEMLSSYNDFKSFSKSKTDVTNYICEIIDIKWLESDQGYVFIITANRFLRNMIRAIVGTLLDIGSGKTSLDDLVNIIESKNRSMAGYSVPAKGLFLAKINYPDKIFL